MNKKFKITSLLLALVLVMCTPAFSATYYDNGSQRFTITAGPQLPVSVTDFSEGKTYVGWGLKENSETSFKPVGGFGSLTYQIFMNPYVAIGGEIGYGFNFYNDDTLLTNVPMLFKLTVVPLQGKFEIPLSLGIGISYMSVSDGGAYLPFFISFETGLDWYITDHWGIGLKTGLWVIPELYMQKSRFDQNALLTVVPITLSVTYRQ